MLNWVFIVLIGSSVLAGAFTGQMKAVTDASISSARSAVQLAIELVGQMGLWMGFMNVLKEAGLMQGIARALSPVLGRLFPDVPRDHPAMGAIVMNLSANVLGLGNAATPFGLKAMVELDKLNDRKGVATNAMALFLAINTSGVAVLPLGVIAIRAGLGSKDPAGIILPSLIATSVSTLVAILAVKLFQRVGAFAPERYEPIELGGSSDRAASARPVAGLAQAEAVAGQVVPPSPRRRFVVAAFWIAVLVGLFLTARRAPESGFDLVRAIASGWLLPILMLGIVSIGFGRKVKVYEAFIAGAKEALSIAVNIFPFLLAILVAIGMFRASGAEGWFVSLLSHVTTPLGLPAEALPMAIIRPLSGSGAIAVMTDVMKTHGPDTLVGNMVSIMNGSTETTFYVLAVYFGAIGVRKLRHTVAACLVSEVFGMSAEVFLAHLFFG